MFLRKAANPLSSILRRTGAAALVASCTAAVLLASCGGGTQSKRFVPDQVVSFGDENSYYALNTGYTYSVNAAPRVSSAANALPTHPGDLSDVDCKSNFLWNLEVAAHFGFGFGDQCAGSGQGAVMLAQDPVTVGGDWVTAKANAGVDRVIASMSSNAGRVNDRTLVTLWAGQPDILAEFVAYQATPTPEQLVNAKLALEQLGDRLAAGIDPIYRTGARVLIVLMPDLGKSPFGVSSGRGAALSEMTSAFNEGLRSGTGGRYDGRQVAGVDGFTLIKSIAENTANNGIVNAAACQQAASSAPLCRDEAPILTGPSPGPVTTGLASADYLNRLWADDTHLSPYGHAQIFNLAISAFNRNPL